MGDAALREALPGGGCVELGDNLLFVCLFVKESERGSEREVRARAVVGGGRQRSESKGKTPWLVFFSPSSSSIALSLSLLCRASKTRFYLFFLLGDKIRDQSHSRRRRDTHADFSSHSCLF